MIGSIEEESKEVKKNLTALRHSYVDLLELKHCLIAADTFFRKVPTNNMDFLNTFINHDISHR